MRNRIRNIIRILICIIMRISAYEMCETCMDISCQYEKFINQFTDKDGVDTVYIKKSDCMECIIAAVEDRKSTCC